MSTLTSALAILGALALLEVLLSADNVLILAVLLQDLPERDQSRAQLYGLVGAVALRLISVLLAFLLLRSALLQLLGALYLIYLPSAHFLSRGEAAAARPTPSFWAAVVKINLADLAFSIDSILAGVALVAHHFQGALAVGLIATGGGDWPVAGPFCHQPVAGRGAQVPVLGPGRLPPGRLDWPQVAARIGG